MSKTLVVSGVAGSVEMSTDATHVPLEVVAIVTGLPLVDLSMEWDDHIIRGEN